MDLGIDIGNFADWINREWIGFYSCHKENLWFVGGYWRSKVVQLARKHRIFCLLGFDYFMFVVC